MLDRSQRNLLLILLLLPVGLLALVSRLAEAPSVVISRWALAAPLDAAAQSLTGRAEPLVGHAAPQAVALAPLERLAAFNAGSVLQDQLAEGRLAFYRRTMAGGGELAYFVVMLDPQVHLEVLNADGAIPGSDATGDTIWRDGGRHLARVSDMVAAPYAAREGMDLVGAMAFGFHGSARTSNEGSVVVNGEVLRVNAGRGVLCVTPEQRALIGLFDAEALRGCRQAIGGGPVILWQGQIANPDVGAPDGEYLPFNPLGEDFVQLDWRIKIYRGTYPKTAVCVGERPDGGSFLVMATSSGLVGTELARALRDLGCASALGGDDDTSTQAVWRGQPVWDRQPRAVPDAIAVYLR
jgi:hypothetical protein